MNVYFCAIFIFVRNGQCVEKDLREKDTGFQSLMSDQRQCNQSCEKSKSPFLVHTMESIKLRFQSPREFREA